MYNYLELVSDLMLEGEEKDDRTGVGTNSLFGRSLKFDLRQGFPLLTVKRLAPRFIFEELMWFLRGETDVRILQDKGVTIWDEWVLPDGTIGPGYGHQMRNFAGVDQLAMFVDGLRNNPDSRRHIITLWNPADIAKMALPPCHGLVIQAYCHSDGGLSLQMYQRSADVFLGLPYNIASYAFFLKMLSRALGCEARELKLVFGDVHLYHNHFDAAAEMLDRTPKDLPTVTITKASRKPAENTTAWLTAMQWTDVEITGYNPHPSIKAPVAV